MAGWQLFEGEGFTILMPDSYEGAGSPEQMQAVIDTLQDSGNEQLAQLVEQNKNSFRFFAANTVITDEGFTSNLNIIGDRNSAYLDTTAAEIGQGVQVQLPQIFPGIEFLEDGTFFHPQYDAYRLVYLIDTAMVGVEGSAVTVQYVMLDGDALWVLSFSTSEGDYEARASEFDTSAASFTVTED